MSLPRASKLHKSFLDSNPRFCEKILKDFIGGSLTQPELSPTIANDPVLLQQCRNNGYMIIQLGDQLRQVYCGGDNHSAEVSGFCPVCETEFCTEHLAGHLGGTMETPHSVRVSNPVRSFGSDNPPIYDQKPDADLRTQMSTWDNMELNRALYSVVRKHLTSKHVQPNKEDGAGEHGVPEQDIIKLPLEQRVIAEVRMYLDEYKSPASMADISTELATRGRAPEFQQQLEAAAHAYDSWLPAYLDSLVSQGKLQRTPEGGYLPVAKALVWNGIEWVLKHTPGGQEHDQSAHAGDGAAPEAEKPKATVGLRDLRIKTLDTSEREKFKAVVKDYEDIKAKIRALPKDKMFDRERGELKEQMEQKVGAYEALKTEERDRVRLSFGEMMASDESPSWEDTQEVFWQAQRGNLGGKDYKEILDKKIASMPKDGNVVYDPAFFASDEEKSTFIKAAQAEIDATPGPKIDVIFGQFGRPRMVERETAEVGEATGYHTNALYSHEQERVMIDHNLYKGGKYAKSALAHEMGHRAMHVGDDFGSPEYRMLRELKSIPWQQRKKLVGGSIHLATETEDTLMGKQETYHKEWFAEMWAVEERGIPWQDTRFTGPPREIYAKYPGVLTEYDAMVAFAKKEGEEKVASQSKSLKKQAPPPEERDYWSAVVHEHGPDGKITKVEWIPKEPSIADELEPTEDKGEQE